MDYRTYQASIDKLGMTQVEAAELMDADARTSRRWAASTGVMSGRNVPRTVLILLQLMLDGHIKRKHIEAAKATLKRRVAQFRD